MDDPTTQGTTEGFGLMFYNARWYDPYITQFSQPDSIIPDPNNPQDWNRYAYARYNPLRFTDPSGHRPCYDVNKNGKCVEDPLSKMVDYTDKFMTQEKRLKNGHSAVQTMIKILIKAAQLYGEDWNGFMNATSFIFLGVYKHGPGTLLAANNQTSYHGFGAYSFGDTGFDPDFQDMGEQVYHFWGYVSNSTMKGLHAFDYTHNPDLGPRESLVGNFAHDIVSDWLGTGGTTAKDYVLGLRGVEMGRQINNGTIGSPQDLANQVALAVSDDNGMVSNFVTNYSWLWQTPSE